MKVVFSYYHKTSTALLRPSDTNELEHTGSLNWLLTSEMTARIDSSFANISSCEPACPPIIADIFQGKIVHSYQKNSNSYSKGQHTWLIIGPNRLPRVLSFPRAFSSTEGNDKKRSVCPVGAVSNTMTENCIDLTCLEPSSVWLSTINLK